MGKIETVSFRLSTGGLIEVHADSWGYGWKTTDGQVNTVRDRKEVDECVKRGLKIIKEG